MTGTFAGAKHMAHHVSRDMDLTWTLRSRDVLLIRDPAEACRATYDRLYARRVRV